MHLILGKMCILMSALGVFSKQSSNHVITGYLNYKNAIWWAVLNTIQFITLANHTSQLKFPSPQGCYYWLLLAIKSHQSFFSVPNKQQMVRGSLMALAPVIAKHTHKQVAQVQSHRGLIRDRRNKTSVYKRNMSAASDRGPSQWHCFYKSSKIKMICCQELMFVNLLRSPLQFKTPVTQISVIIIQTSSHKHCINIKGRLCSMRDYLYSQWQLNTHSRPFPHTFSLQWVHQSSLGEKGLHL